MKARLVDVAARAGVSPGTVSNFLNSPDKVAKTTAARIHAAIADLGYTVNSAAQTTRTGTSRTIALVVTELGNPTVDEVNAAVESRAAELGYSVIVANSGGSSRRLERYLDLFEARQVDGLLLAATAGQSDRIASLRARGFGVVVAGMPPADLEVSSVLVDDFAGGRMAASHLLDVGRRRLAFLGGPMSLPAMAARFEGASAAVAKVGGASLELIEVTDRTIAAGRKAGRALAGASERPTGIFAANDLLGIGLLNGLLGERAVRVPEDIAIVGFDDVEFARDSIVPLTSIAAPWRQIGEVSLDLLLSEIAHRRSEGEFPAPVALTFAPRLVPRRSTRAHDIAVSAPLSTAGAKGAV
ncbi:LacI family DNA-binding transcriptional regulator [Microbacterium sp. NPDC091313]